MKFAVTGLDGVSKWANGVAKAIDQAGVIALNRTAFKVKEAEQASMRTVFDRPTPYTLRNVFVKRAKPSSSPSAEVGMVDNRSSGVPPVKYLAPQVYGGPRNMKSHEKKLGKFAAPSRFAPLDSYGNVPGNFYKRVLSQLQLSSDPMQNATNSARSRKKRAAESFYIAGNVLLSSKGGVSRPMLFLFDKAPEYKARFPFHKVADETYLTAFPPRYAEEIKKAMRR